MLKLTIYDTSYSDALNRELCEFVSTNTAELVQLQLELVEGTDYNLEFIFPRAYVNTHSREECYEVFRTICDRLSSAVLYQEFKPLQQYVLYNVIEIICEYDEVIPKVEEQFNKKLPDRLKDLIRKEIVEADFVIESAEDIHQYIGLLFDDTDFEEDQIRALVELAIKNTEFFLNTEMSLEDLDRYIEVMPLDVVEEYKEFREKNSEDNKSVNINEEIEMTGKPKKLFISHAGKDEPYVSAIVDLLVSIGLTQEEVFCSSIPGFDIVYGDDIYECLRNQFVNYDLYVLFILSDNYYKSAACLNEMGATWVLQKKYDSILLPGFEFVEIDGAVNPRKKAMKLEGYSAGLKNSLKQFADDLVKEFGLKEISSAIWERYRDRLLDAVNSIPRPVDNNEQETQPQSALNESLQLCTDDEKILTYYLLTKQVCNVEEAKVREWLIDDEVYDVNVQNGFTLLASLENGKYEEHRLALDIGVFRNMMAQKDSLISEYASVVNSHRYISAEEFQKMWSSMRNCAKLLAAYISDEKVSRLGTRWMADSQIESIKAWEKKNSVAELLSKSYDEAIQFFIDNRFVYESDWTAYNNPREYTVCKSLKELLWSGMSDYIEEIKKS